MSVVPIPGLSLCVCVHIHSSTQIWMIAVYLLRNITYYSIENMVMYFLFLWKLLFVCEMSLIYFLKVIFHLYLLLDIGYIPHAVQYIPIAYLIWVPYVLSALFQVFLCFACFGLDTPIHWSCLPLYLIWCLMSLEISRLMFFCWGFPIILYCRSKSLVKFFTI